MFPYHDENETIRTPYVTYVLIAVTALVWLMVQGAGGAEPLARSVCNFGLIPGELTGQAPPGSGFRMDREMVCQTDPGLSLQNIITSMFLHGGWMHLLGNMWFLWLFGNNVEDAMTRPRFVAFYLLTGLAAALAQVASEPASIVPMVGASGAISGVMGAYLVLYPTARVYTLIPLGLFATTMALPAWGMLIYWAFLQFAGGLTAVEGKGGVAFWAHLGGFLAGVILVKLFNRSDFTQSHRARHWRPQRAG